MYKRFFEVSESGKRLATVHVIDADEAIHAACLVHPEADAQKCTATLIEIKSGVMPATPLRSSIH